MKGLRPLFTGEGKDFPPSLTAEVRQSGRRLFWRFYTLNGISVACLMNNVLVLYAIRNGLDDSMVAVMASFVHLVMPFMILGKPAVSRFGAARTRGLGWFLRYASATIMLLGPAVAPFTSQAVVTALIMSGAFGFAVFRSIGTAALSPLAGEVAESDERGKFFSMVFALSQSSYLVTMALIVTLFRYVDELWVYQLVIGTGCVVGFYASTVIALVPESSAPRHSAQKPFAEMVSNSWKNARNRRLLFAWCAGVIAHVIVIPFMMITVKNGYEVSDFTALVFALILVLGGVISGVVNRKIADIAGARLLLMLYVLGLIAVAVFWSRAPGEFLPGPVAATFLLAGFCHIGISIGLNQYFLTAIPGSDRVGNALVMRIASGAAAGLAGSVVGGGLLRLLSSTGMEELAVYRSYFQLILVLLVMLLLVVRRLEQETDGDGA